MIRFKKNEQEKKKTFVGDKIERRALMNERIIDYINIFILYEI